MGPRAQARFGWIRPRFAFKVTTRRKSITVGVMNTRCSSMIVFMVVLGSWGCSDSSGTAGLGNDDGSGSWLDTGKPNGLNSFDAIGDASDPDVLVLIDVEDGFVDGDLRSSDLSSFDGRLGPDSVADSVVPVDAGDAQSMDSGGEEPDGGADATQSAVSPTSGWCSHYAGESWSRKIDHAGGTVTFNEILYHPLTEDGVEWIELYNPMTIDMDLSSWRLEGGISYVFPEGTLLPSGSYLIIASDPGPLLLSVAARTVLGPFDGKLSNGGEKLELWNNYGRLMDQVDYGDRHLWSVLPDGSGASLAKRDPNTASESAENWTHSGMVGGTPGSTNFEKPKSSMVFEPLVTLDSDWRYDADGELPGALWADPLFDDDQWATGKPIFWSKTAPVNQGDATALFTADNFFALYTGDKSGKNLKWIGRDSIGDWTSAESFPLPVQTQSHLYVAAWEAPGSDGGPQMLIGQVQLSDGTIFGTDSTSFEAVVGPPNASPGGSLSDPSPSVAMLSDLIATADSQQSWLPIKAYAPKTAAPWGGALSTVFQDAAQYIWPDTFDSFSVTNQQNSFVLFRSKTPILPQPGQTELPKGPVTVYFRTHFELSAQQADVDLWLDVILDDGAVVWLNGQEVLRVNMPDGQITPMTPALAGVGTPLVKDGIALPTTALMSGDNVLAVELHDALDSEEDRAFGLELFAAFTENPSAGGFPPLKLHEVSAGGVSPFWLEVKNVSTTPQALHQWKIVREDGAFFELPDSVLEPGDIRLFEENELGLGAMADDVIFLMASNGNSVVDGVRVAATPQARPEIAVSGDDSWFFPDSTTPGASNMMPWVPPIVINEIQYHTAPIASEMGQTTPPIDEWVELFNAGTAPVDLSGWSFRDGFEFVFPDQTLLLPGAYLVVAKDAATFSAANPGVFVVGDFDGGLDNGGERIELRDACGNLVDEVAYRDGGRWPKDSDGMGATLELRDPHADNDVAEAWGPSHEGLKSNWVDVSYEGVVQPSAVGPDGVWKEFVVGLLDAGVVLIDNLSVMEDPGGAAVERIQNGTFDGGTTDGWRIVGNHRHSHVVADPENPQNKVLRLVATGSSEHMHNHAETTFIGNNAISNGKTVKISYSARWESGSNQLNTRLYFNRLAKTTLLARPLQSGTPGSKNSIAVDNLGPTYGNLNHAQAVPKPFEPVWVTVSASDPDGVAGLVLWTSVGGAPFSPVPMTMGGTEGVYSAVVPGQPAATLVQFYVEGKDTLGAISWFPAKGPESRAMWKVDDGLKATNDLHNVRIIMTKADADWMHTPVNLMSNDPIECTVIVDEEVVVYGATVRTKGSQRGRPEVKRLGYALRFPNDNRFRGIYRSVFIDRSEGVGFGQREMLMNVVQGRAGSVTAEYHDLAQVITPRLEHTGPAELQLSRFSDQLLDFQFADGGDGLLYEYELIYYPLTTNTGTPEGLKLPQPDSVQGVPITNLGGGFGEEKERYRHTFTLKNNRERDDFTQIIQFAKTFGQSGWAFQEQIEGVIDLDQWLRTFAFTKLSGCVDNYGSDGAQHNAQFYVRPEDNLVLYFPHDMDFYPGSPTSPVVGAGDLSKLLWSQTNMRTYYGHLYDIIQSAYNDAYMAYFRDHFAKLLPGQNFAGHHQFLVARSNHVLNGAPDSILKTYPQVEFVITTNGGADMTVATSWITVEGQGWIDVRNIYLSGTDVPLVVDWWNKTGWQTDVALSCGLNELMFEARSHQGKIVGQDMLKVVREGPDCP